jgi:hypothetical protein
MGDVAALTEAILAQLDSTAPAGMVESVTARFHEDRIVEQYLDVLMQERQ